jgi:hypothetical protein
MGIDETICYDIQMVRGPGNLINRSILDDYDNLFDSDLVTDIRAAAYCTGCPFNQLPGVPTELPARVAAAVY